MPRARKAATREPFRSFFMINFPLFRFRFFHLGGRQAAGHFQTCPCPSRLEWGPLDGVNNVQCYTPPPRGKSSRKIESGRAAQFPERRVQLGDPGECDFFFRSQVGVWEPARKRSGNSREPFGSYYVWVGLSTFPRTMTEPLGIPRCASCCSAR
uniref:Uncharacterized protein n=1 Tax=Candidatus Kentrum sp. LPFa TaxID=2126335 RepID=A0A450XL37_9GAMM|nr:MAG: hypothetical protein BECKLPF1236C_GA0070990_1010012 [Candidatus Kentron sp. LPFa]